MLMRIFTPSLYFQCVFNDFQCVITLLRTLSYNKLFARTFPMICHCLGKFSTTINDAKFGMGKNLYIKKKEKKFMTFRC